MSDSIPEPAVGAKAAAFSKPADAETNPEPTDPVRRAVTQLRAWGDLNQAEVSRFLPLWRHFRSLTAQEILAIVDSFPIGDDDTGAGMIMRGGGYISGPGVGGSPADWSGPDHPHGDDEPAS